MAGGKVRQYTGPGRAFLTRRPEAATLKSRFFQRRERSMRIQRRPFVASLLFLLAPSGLLAQTFNLRDLLTNFLIEGILLAPPAHGLSPSAHFIDAGQLSSFPLASSAGGFTYRFDPELGVLTRTTDSFGPIYTERADTIGQGRFNFGVNYSSFTFD